MIRFFEMKASEEDPSFVNVKLMNIKNQALRILHIEQADCFLITTTTTLSIYGRSGALIQELENISDEPFIECR